jgi:hypothetical protein
MKAKKKTSCIPTVHHLKTGQKAAKKLKNDTPADVISISSKPGTSSSGLIYVPG